MDAIAVILNAPERLALRPLRLNALGAADVLVEIHWSGVSSGTEKLLWTGRMPPFPGMGYPLVPGYESIGEIVDAGSDAAHRIGEWVFVPGAACWADARSLFGGTARRVTVAGARVVPLPRNIGRDGILLALAATAHHALAGGAMPDLVIGHGILGRLIARVAIAAGATPPTIWETRDTRRAPDSAGVTIVHPEADPRRDYRAIYDASGDAAILDGAIARLRRGGEIVLAGFYDRPLSFDFAPAFRREARLRIAAEFTPDDMAQVIALIASGNLRLDGLVSHVRPAAEAVDAYPAAFEDPDCLKMVLDWSDCA